MSNPAALIPAGRPASAKADSVSYLALGDSYTIGESIPAQDRYPLQTVQLLRSAKIACGDPDIVAATGWTTADLHDAITDFLGQRKAVLPNYDLVSLLIGVNDQYRGMSLAGYKERFTGLLQEAIALAGNRPGHVIVLSIPDYSVTPYLRRLAGPNTAQAAGRIAAEINAFNEANRSISAAMGAHYLDITGESRKAGNDSSLIAADGLHFSGKEYAIWSRAMQPLAEAALGN